MSTSGTERFDIMTPTKLATAGVVLSALALESTWALATKSRQREKTEIISHDGDGQRAIYIIPGCRSDGRFVAKHLGVDLAELGNTHTVVYPERGFSADKVGEELLATRRYDKSPASFYVMSMGGMVLTHLLRDREFCNEFGEIENVVFDSSPADVAHLEGSAKKGITASKYVPDTPTISYVYSRVVQRGAVKLRDLACDNYDLMLEHVLSTAHTPLSAVRPQTRFIDRTHFSSGELRHAPIENMSYLSAASDGVVDVATASSCYADIYDRELPHVIDESRPDPSHAMGVEYADLAKGILADGKVQPRKTEPGSQLQLVSA